MKRLFVILLISLCAPASSISAGPGDTVTTVYAAPTLHRWLPVQPPKAVILALHSHGDHHAAFNHWGSWFAERGIALYSYDQAGFGARKNAGHWPGHERLEAELSASIAAIRREQDAPLFLMGESLGAAVAISVTSGPPAGEIAGVILAAPAIREDIPFRLGWNLLIATAATLAPGYRLDVTRDANDPRLHGPSARRLALDQKVHRQVRLDAYWGLIRLADRASRQVRDLQQPTLLMYGGQDTSVPAVSIRRASDYLEKSTDFTFRYYPQGIHLLLQSAQWQDYAGDIEHWLQQQLARPPVL